MIGLLQGLVVAIGQEDCLINVHGVGYVVSASARTLANLPARGEAVELMIETVVREDSLRLYGFLSEAERSWFVRLQSIQGVGSKVALALLDVLGPDDLIAAAAMEDKSAFARASGVGPKLAGRIAVELKGKNPPVSRFGGLHASTGKSSAQAGSPNASSGQPAADASLQKRHEAVSALVNLGLEPEVARKAVQDSADSEPDAGLDGLIRAALKKVANR
jgi:holliday junction DNA helicase RuvA